MAGNVGASGTARKSKSSASDVAIFAHDRLCSGAASGEAETEQALYAKEAGSLRQEFPIGQTIPMKPWLR